MEKYSATLGLQPKKNVEFLGAELGTLSRDVCPHGPKIDSGYFWCTMYTWGLCPFLGTEIFPKNLAPKKLSRINLGTTPRRHHTQGSEKNAT